MGAFHQAVDAAQQVEANPPQTGANPNPAAVTYDAQPTGKGGAMPQYGSPNSTQPAGKGGSNVTYPSTSGQPQTGVPNLYANTIQSGDNPLNGGLRTPMKGKGF